ncbi:uncharacterized [Tachysurus ichikawai]
MSSARLKALNGQSELVIDSTVEPAHCFKASFLHCGSRLGRGSYSAVYFFLGQHEVKRLGGREQRTAWGAYYGFRLMSSFWKEEEEEEEEEKNEEEAD